MAKRHKAFHSTHKDNPQIIAMALVGAGLLMLGGLAFLLLPKDLAASSRSGETASTIPVAVDYPSPELNLIDVKGSQASLKDYQSQVILVNNWATWCPPCRAEMPTLQEYFEDHQKQGFTVIAIEAGESASEVAKFAEEYGLTFPVWADPDQKALAEFRNMALPNSYVIDRHGQVRLAWTGAINREMLEKYVTPLLEE
jgi:peroxiredoxin